MEMKDMEKRTAKVRRETEPLDRSGKIYVAGHRGLVGSALVRRLEKDGFTNLITRTHAELDLTRQADVEAFLSRKNRSMSFWQRQRWAASTQTIPIPRILL